MLRTPPFARAPFLLLRHRVVLTAVLGAALILGLVVALTPQFLSSAASTALTHELSGRCAASYAGSLAPRRSFNPGVRYPGVTEENRQRITSAIGDQANVSAPRATIVGRTLFLVPEAGPDAGVNMTILYRDDYDQHLDLMSGGGTDGLWIDEYASEQYGIGVGDRLSYEFSVTLPDDTQRLVTGEFEVSAVTEEHVGVRTEGYWCGVGDLIGLSPTGDRLTPVGLVPLSVFGDWEYSEFEEPPDSYFLRGDEYWELPVETDGLSLSIADEILTSFDDVGREVMFRAGTVRTDLELTRDRIAALYTALATSVRPLALVVVVVAFGLLGGAGSYWVDRRRQELQLLSVLGIGPWGIATKALLEMLIPIVVGVGAGALLSILIAPWLAPGGAVEPHAVVDGLLLGLPSAAFALVLVAVVAGLRASRLLAEKRQSGASIWWALPFAAALFVSAYLLRQRIGINAVDFGEGELVGSVDPLVIFFPLLIFGAVALVTAATLLFFSSRLKNLGSNHSYYMAIRRILSARGAVVVLLLGSLLPIATLVYSAALTRTTEDSIGTKGGVFIGSDVRAPVYGFDPLPGSLVDRATYVRRAERVDFGGTEVDFLVVDPATFPDGSFWRDEFADVSLTDLLGYLDGAGVPLPAIAANARLDREQGEVDLGLVQVPVQIRAQINTFPGARAGRPIIVIGREGFEAYLDSLRPLSSNRDGTLKYLWVRGLDGDSVEAALNSADIGFAFTTTIDEALDLTKFQAIIWTFDFLELYAALAGVIVVGAILLYADTRQRSRNLSYALSLRMGLTRREHLIAGFMEFGSITLTGGTVGSIAAYAAARSIYKSLDALPATPPKPIWSGVVGLVTVLLIVTVAVSFMAASVSQRTADNADVPSLLRHGE